MKHYGKKLLSLALVFSMLTGLLVTGVSAAEPPAAEPKVETVQNAVLYQIKEGKLEYNVTHSAEIADNAVVNGRGGVASLDALQTALGVADAPEAVHGVEVGERTLSSKAYYADLTLTDGKITKISVTGVSQRPVIGISWSSNTVSDSYKGFAEAYERNGAYAVYLPQLETAEEAQEVLNQVDGVFVTGGEDWGTNLYTPPEPAYPHGTTGVNAARDTSDINLMQQAIALDVPMFMVCRGEQGFNIAMGGGLIQDIPTYLGKQVLEGKIAPERVTRVEGGLTAEVQRAIATANNTTVDKLPELLKTEVPDPGITSWVQDSAGNWSPVTTPCTENHLRVWVDGNQIGRASCRERV